MKNFQTDLKKGQVYEKKFAQYLVDEHSYTHIQFNDDAKFDIIATREEPDETIKNTFEIKTDFYENTENMAIELMCLSRGKVTGLYATEANYFVYIFPHLNTYVFKVKDIKDFIKDNNIKITRGGDNNWAIIALAPINEIKNIAYKTIRL